MYRRPKFLEVLLSIREDLAREADYDTDLFAEMVRAGMRPAVERSYEIVDATENSKTQPKRRRPRKSKD